MTIPYNAIVPFKLYLYPISGEFPVEFRFLKCQNICWSARLVQAPLADDLQYVLILNQSNGLPNLALAAQQHPDLDARQSSACWSTLATASNRRVGTYNDGYGGITAMYVDDVSLEICK